MTMQEQTQAATAVTFSITAEHIERQHEFSLRTFGPGPRTTGVLDHIRKELVEVESAPDDLSEWADVVILTFDGARRRGFAPQAILDAVLAKQVRNEGRTWPDWRTQPTDRAIEHDRTTDAPVQPGWLGTLVDTAQDALDNDGGYLAADEREQIEAAVASTRAVPVRPDDQARNILRTAARLAGWDMEEYDRVAALAYGGPVQPDPLRAGVDPAVIDRMDPDGWMTEDGDWLTDPESEQFVADQRVVIDALRALLAGTEAPRG